MTASSFDEALKRVLVHEGGYANHPADPGGATMKGVTQRVYDSWRRRQGKAPRAVRQIAADEVKAIYRAQYWDVIRADELPPGVDYFAMDGAVNSGPSQAVKWLQRALGVAADGQVGAVTLAALKAHPDHDALIADMAKRRLAMLKGLKTWKTFGAGWSRRVAEALAHGQAAAMGSVGPAPTYSEEGAQRARLDDIAKPPAPIGGSAGTIAGGGGTAVLIDQAKKSLEPMIGSGGIIDQVFAGLVVAGVVVAIGGAAYAFWASRRNARNAAIASGDAVADLSELPAIGAVA
ncbi:glycoside hydrolase family 108 protein [Ancylobacter sp. VNQ12]|uniref:glycoside hydrolase family 108 protein n=1 Tax=Ancylobacter sp. VNQ12 TaxID=3400920 RepID=UPI003C109370